MCKAQCSVLAHLLPSASLLNRTILSHILEARKLKPREVPSVHLATVWSSVSVLSHGVDQGGYRRDTEGSLGIGMSSGKPSVFSEHWPTGLLWTCSLWILLRPLQGRAGCFGSAVWESTPSLHPACGQKGP